MRRRLLGENQRSSFFILEVEYRILCNNIKEFHNSISEISQNMVKYKLVLL